MVGDRIGDIKFGKGLAMKTAIVGHDEENWVQGCKLADCTFDDLYVFARFVQENTK